MNNEEKIVKILNDNIDILHFPNNDGKIDLDIDFSNTHTLYNYFSVDYNYSSNYKLKQIISDKKVLIDYFKNNKKYKDDVYITTVSNNNSHILSVEFNLNTIL